MTKAMKFKNFIKTQGQGELSIKCKIGRKKKIVYTIKKKKKEQFFVSTETDLGLFERGDGLGIEPSSGVRGRGQDVGGESPHEAAYGGALGGAGGGDDGGLDRQRLLRQPQPEPRLHLLEPGLQLRDWVRPNRRRRWWWARHKSTLLCLHFSTSLSSTWS